MTTDAVERTTAIGIPTSTPSIIASRNTTNAGTSNSTVGVIIGGVIGVGVVAAVVLTTICVLLCKRRSKKPTGKFHLVLGTSEDIISKGKRRMLIGMRLRTVAAYAIKYHSIILGKFFPWQLLAYGLAGLGIYTLQKQTSVA